MKCSCGKEAEGRWCADCIAERKLYHPKRVVFVCGPPGAGKSTFVARHRRPGDIVWDFDAVMAAITGRDSHERVDGATGFVLGMRDGFFSKIHGNRGSGRVWVIEMAPRAADRERFKTEYDAAIVLLATPEQVCCERLKARGSGWAPRVADWWAQYRRYGEL